MNPASETWLSERALDPELCVRLGIESTQRAGGEAIVIPYTRNGEVVNRKYRALTGGWSQDSGGTQCLWNEDCLRDTTLEDQPPIITEGEWDALAAIQAGYPKTLSVPNGAPSKQVEHDGPKYRYLDDVLPLLHKAPYVILAADGDEPGANLLHDLSIRIGTHRCKFLRYPKGCKDLNQALEKYGTKGVVETINRAQWMDVSGLKLWSDIPDRPKVPAFNHGVDGLEHLFRIRPGDFSVLTGYANHGKSQLALNIAGNMIVRHDWKVLLGSLEDEKPDLEMKLATFYAGMLRKDMPETIADEAREWISRNFVFMHFDPDADGADLAQVLDIMAAAVTRHDVKMIVLDPWNEIEHDRPPGMSLTEYVGKSLRLIRRFARKYMVHVMVCAHPAKPQKLKDGSYPEATLYDISDSAHWANKSDLGIVVTRNGDDTTTVKTKKVKYQPTMGVLGEATLQFDKSRGTYRAA